MIFSGKKKVPSKHAETSNISCTTSLDPQAKIPLNNRFIERNPDDVVSANILSTVFYA